MSVRKNLAARLVAAAVLAFAAASAGTALAQSDDEAKDLDELVARLRNPFFAKQADRDLQIVQLLLRRRSARADACLRELLGDTGAHPTVVEQIAIATLIDAEHRLLPELVDRLRREEGSELDRSLDLPILTYSDGPLVQRLVELARDADRAPEFRAKAVEFLGRTGSPEALDPLLDLWGGPQKDLREPAARAFERILPAGAATREEAVLLREAIRGVPFTEALRRIVRRLSARAETFGAASGVETDYVKLATQMLPSATLQQVLETYLVSSVPAVRAMAARRIAEFSYDSAETDGKVRAARACLDALRREDVESVELEILGALTARAQELRGAVGEEDLAAIVERVRLAGRASHAVRLASVRLVGELRDARAIAVMQETFSALKDGDVELRLALLDALQQAPGDFTAWLIERLGSETHTRVVRKLVVLLNRAEDPAALGAFRALLANHADQQVRWDVVKALGTLWASRQVAAARDALVELGLADADPTVRRTSAASLGSAGPGRDLVIAGLQKLLARESDAKVRQAAAKSIVDLDAAGAAANLLPHVADDAEIWRLFRDQLVEDVRRRDKTPERVLDAANVLVDHELARLAIDLLRQVGAAHGGLWESEGGRGEVLERLAGLLLEQGDPDAAKTVARELVDATPKAAAGPLRRAELLLATAYCRAGRREELRDARRMLDLLRYAEELSPAQRAEAAVELGDCMLRGADAIAAVHVLTPIVALRELPAATAKRAALLLEDARRRADDDRKQILGWVDALDGSGAGDARTRLAQFGPRATLHLAEALDDPGDAPRVRRLLRAAAIVTGRSLADVRDDSSPADVARIAAEARAALRAIAQRSADLPDGER